MIPLAADCAALLARVRERRPLVHHLVNFVTANDVANATLAFGASPVMARAAEEVEEIAAQAAAVALNLGTPTAAGVEVMLRAGRRANAAGAPVIFDPVGAGATSFRTAQAHRILDSVRVACVRGNAGEVAALCGRRGTVRGVDARAPGEALDDLARTLARDTGAVVAATGPVDVVSDGIRTVRLANGHPQLGRIAGGGCMATAAVAVFCAVEADAFAATVAALVCYEVAAEDAAAGSGGPGTFRAALLDAIASLDGATVSARARISPS